MLARAGGASVSYRKESRLGYTGNAGAALVRMLLGALLATAACHGNSPDELLELARFEERQNNRQHARELYEQIIAKAPNSEAARTAVERLKALPHD
ncbi:MAG: tetratricopeptide repeat protein [Candidatus Binatia bacterium]